MEEANQEQKRFMILFEQKGCGYCKKMHEKVYSIPEIASTLQDDFFVIRINIFGDLEVTNLIVETDKFVVPLENLLSCVSQAIRRLGKAQTSFDREKIHLTQSNSSRAQIKLLANVFAIFFPIPL